MMIFQTLCAQQSATPCPFRRQISFFGTLLLLLVTQALLAQTWTGQVNTDWNTAGNWLPNTVPTANDNVFIPATMNSPTIMGGTSAVVRSVQVQSGNTLTVQAGASLVLQGTQIDEMYNEGTITNNGLISISGGQHGLVNLALFNNNAGAELHIDQASGSGLYNSMGTFSNAGKITIGALMSPGFYGLSNTGAFTNSGEISIDRAIDIGLSTTHLSTFTNTGKIVVGAVSGNGNYGFSIQGAFDNAGGEIQIDRSILYGISNFDGIFSNTGKITIGALAGVGPFGIFSNNLFSNNAGGQIFIDRSTVAGLENDNTGTFTNASKIIIGGLAGLSGSGIQNEGTFDNGICAVLEAFAPLKNIGVITNGGLFSMHTAGVHTNTNFTNNGILEYPQGSPIPNVTNNDVVVVPVIAACGPLTPALKIGGSNSFAIGSQWFTDQGLNTKAGDYNQGSNTFTVTSLTKGQHTLYFNIHDIGAGCDETVAIQVTYGDVIPPTVVCKNYAANLSAAGMVSIIPANVYQSGSDNCGSVNLQSVVPASFTCSDIGIQPVTLTVNDGNGNTATCSAKVTVKDVTPPVAKCQDATANLDANGTAWVKAASINNGSTDNCSFTLLLSPNNFGCGQVGGNVVTLTATDAGGNTATCTAKVQVKDVTAPLALCKNPTIYLDDNGQATLSAAQADNGSSDACGIATMGISKTQFNCSELQGSPWNLTLNVTDVHGLTASCLFQVTVKDKILPTAICKDATVHLGANGKVIVYPAELAADSYDNCSVWSYSPTAKTYTGANLGPNNLTVTVKDWSGNASSCVSVVTVQPYTGVQGGGNDRSQEPVLSPEELALNVFPNPSTGAATAAFQLPVEQAFSLKIFDLSGRVIWRLEAIGLAGENNIPLPLTDVAAGIYLIDFQSDGLSKQTKLSVQN